MVFFFGSFVTVILQYELAKSFLGVFGACKHLAPCDIIYLLSCQICVDN